MSTVAKRPLDLTDETGIHDLLRGCVQAPEKAPNLAWFVAEENRLYAEYTL